MRVCVCVCVCGGGGAVVGGATCHHWLSSSKKEKRRLKKKKPNKAKQNGKKKEKKSESNSKCTAAKCSAVASAVNSKIRAALSSPNARSQVSSPSRRSVDEMSSLVGYSNPWPRLTWTALRLAESIVRKVCQRRLALCLPLASKTLHCVHRIFIVFATRRVPVEKRSRPFQPSTRLPSSLPCPGTRSQSYFYWRWKRPVARQSVHCWMNVLQSPLHFCFAVLFYVRM